VAGLTDLINFGAEATAMIGGLWGVLAQARKPIGEKSELGLIQERMRLEEQIGKIDRGEMASFGVNERGMQEMGQELRARLAEVDEALRRARLPAVTILENG